jgi:hypothetical protein
MFPAGPPVEPPAGWAILYKQQLKPVMPARDILFIDDNLVFK